MYCSDMVDDVTLADSVPFSCCSPRAVRPCVHKHILRNNTNYNPDTDLTVNPTGCVLAIIYGYRLAIAIPVGLVSFLMSAWLVMRFIISEYYNYNVNIRLIIPIVGVDYRAAKMQGVKSI